jgi:hypothetical protein
VPWDTTGFNTQGAERARKIRVQEELLLQKLEAFSSQNQAAKKTLKSSKRQEDSKSGKNRQEDIEISQRTRMIREFRARTASSTQMVWH